MRWIFSLRSRSLAAAALWAFVAGMVPAAAPAAALITSPKAGDAVSGKVAIKGTATLPLDRFQFFKVEWQQFAANNTRGETSGANPGWNAIGGIQTTPVVDDVLATWDVSALPNGPYTILLTVVNKDSNYAQASVLVRVENAGFMGTAQTSLPGPAFTAPAADAVVSGRIQVVGSATLDPAVYQGFQFYKVEAAPADDLMNPIVIGLLHSGPVPAGPLETWDTTTVPNGRYVLTITAVDQSGNYQQAQRQVTVRN